MLGALKDFFGISSRGTFVFTGTLLEATRTGDVEPEARPHLARFERYGREWQGEPAWKHLSGWKGLRVVSRGSVEIGVVGASESLDLGRVRVELMLVRVFSDGMFQYRLAAFLDGAPCGGARGRTKDTVFERKSFRHEGAGAAAGTGIRGTKALRLFATL